MFPDPPSGKSGWPWDAPAGASSEIEHPLQISIVVPTLNQARFLEEALRSVLLQRWPSVELIVIDGGSDDGSVDILRGYDEYLSYWVSEPDSGQAAAINKGLSHATGEWVAWLNSDDIYLPHTFELLAKLITRHPGCDWVVGTTTYLSDSLDEVGLFEPAVGRLSEDGLARWMDFACSKRSGTALPQPSSFWTRRVQEKAGPLDESLSLAMDHELWVRFARCGYEPLLTRKPLAGFRFHVEQKTSRGMCFFWEEERRLVARLVSEVQGRERAVLEAYDNELRFRIRWELMKTRLEKVASLPFVGSFYRFAIRLKRRIRHLPLIRSLLNRLRDHLFGRMS